jgi:hypothetical protein
VVQVKGFCALLLLHFGVPAAAGAVTSNYQLLI